ncbi:MAG: penicillin-insensitive murein endopeptidase [Myxococcota bacterium]
MSRPLALALWCVLSWTPVRAFAEAPVVVVQPGDALSLIAVRHGVSVDDIKRWNQLESDLIRAGQKLRVAPTEGSDEEGIDWTPPFDYGSEVAAPEPHSAPIAARETAIAVATARNATRERKRGRSYTVRRGDTMTAIAARNDTTVAELLEINPGLHPDRIRPGQTIGVGQPRPEVRFKLERGDTLLAVASRYRVSAKDLARWNKGVRQGRARAGSEIRLYTHVPVSPSQAVGPTNRGKLVAAVQLPNHAGYVIRDPHRAYGTEETTRWLVDAFDSVNRKFKRPKKVRVHDISDRNGGPLRGHKSHQNGRDVDVSYYQDDCGRQGCAFKKVKPSQLDVARQWALLSHWLRNEQASMIFIDYRLQAKLYRYARKKGVPEADLRRWFQYPRGKYEPAGVIRHFRNHEDHLHVRFVCPYSDLKCRR